MFRMLSVVLLTVVSTLAQVPNSQTQSSLPHTLAKIMFAHQVSVINLLASKTANRETTADLQQALATEDLQLSVVDSSEGPISAIANHSLTGLVTWLPDNKKLDIVLALTSVSNERGLIGDEAQAQVHWGETGSMSPIPASLTLEGLGSADQRYTSYKTCTSYIAATIKATYQGQAAQWKALYLLGCAKGEVLAVDLVMDDAVSKFWSASVYPYTLLRADGIRGRTPAVQEWLQAHGSATCTGTQACFENGAIMVPKQKIPALRTTSGIKPPNTSDGLSCPDYGFSHTSTLSVSSPEDHYTQNHTSNDANISSCSYWGQTTSGDQGPCTSDANVSPSAVNTENGVTIFYFHRGSTSIAGGDVVKPPHTTSTAEGVAASQFNFCLLGICSGGSLSISGYSVNFGQGSHFDQQIISSITCAPQTGGPGSSPLVVDTLNRGWLFVDPAVSFDMNVTGTPQITAWPDGTQGIAFLALPDQRMQITSGLQLFGNHTPQGTCPSDHPHCENGFRALAVYDDNGDGVIDQKDKVWPHLRLWIDKNMDGKVDGGELETMSAAGITSISLDYSSTFIHVNRGTLRYQSTLVGLTDNLIFDVFLSQLP